MESNIIETRTVGDITYRVRLEQDEDATNPRTEYDNVGHALTVPDRRYHDVDKDGGPLSDRWDRIKSHADGIALFIRWAHTFHGAVTELYTPNNGPASVWYILPSEVAEHGITDPLSALRGEIDEYQAWVDGDVYGYVIERSATWQRIDDSDIEMTTWEAADGDTSCWGFVGYEYAEAEAKREFTDYLEGLRE